MRLFTYADLEQPGKPAAAVHGVLRRRNERDAAARFNARAKTVVHGFLTDDYDLNKLDETEAPEYSRVRVRTTGGEEVYAYEYMERDFTSLPLIPSGRFHKPKTESDKEDMK